MTSILREFEKTMKLEPIQVNYTEPSILDSVDLSDATSTLSFSDYKISFDENDSIGQEPPKAVKKKEELPFSKFYVKGKGTLSSKQVQSLKNYLISVRQYAGKRAAAPYNDVVDLVNSALSGQLVAKKVVNELSEELFNEMKRIFE